MIRLADSRTLRLANRATVLSRCSRSHLFFVPAAMRSAMSLSTLRYIVERPREYRRGNPMLEVPHDVAHKACARRFIQYTTHHGSRLTKVVVLKAYGVRLAHHAAVDVPKSRRVGARGIGLGAPHGFGA